MQRWGLLPKAFEARAEGMDLADVRILLDRNRPSRNIMERFDERIGAYVLDVRVAARAAGSKPAPPPGGHNATLVPFWFRANRRKDTRWITWLPFDEACTSRPGSSPGQAGTVP